MLRELKTFVTVARLGTFAAAGQRIGLTQSAVSAQIRVLEQGLGVRLFDRSGRAAVLNAAGRHALPLAEQMLSLYGQMALPSDVAEWRGELKIGAIATLQTGLLPEALPRFREKAPHIELKLVPGVSLNLLGQVDAGELDLALLIKPPFALPKELLEVSLAREPFVLIAPESLPATIPCNCSPSSPSYATTAPPSAGGWSTAFSANSACRSARRWSWTNWRPSCGWSSAAWAFP